MNVPKIRFKEFSDEWDYKTFDELIDIKSNTYNPSNNNINYRCIELEHINQGSGTINGYCNSNEQKSNKNIFKNGDVLFGKLRPYLKKYWYASFDGVCSSEIWVAKSKDNNKIINKFIFDIFQSHYFLQLCNLSTGSKMPRADWSFIKEQSIPIPSIKEQEKISNTLELFNKKIELQSKKIEDLKLFKLSQSNLIKIDDSYKKISLKNILKEYNEKSTINNQYEILSSTAKGIFLQSEYFNKQAASENNIGYKILRKNQLVLSPQNLWMGNININNKYEIGIVSPSYKIFDINTNVINIEYFKNWIKSPRALYEYMISSEQGASIVRRNLNMDLFNEITLSVPNMNEQNKIGKMLSLIDNKILLEEDKYKKLLELKKGLMQNMFV